MTDGSEGLTLIIEEVLKTGLNGVPLDTLTRDGWMKAGNDPMYRKYMGKFCAVYRCVDDLDRLYEFSHISYLRMRDVE